ncbi:MAG: AAA family ATPase [Candidatus Bipolaricaulia bacterium]
MNCVNCGFENPEDARFCNQCGAPLAAASQPSPAPSDAEYKLVTVLFADVVGSTALGETLDAETVHLIMDRCLRRMSQAVDDSGGTVARLMGDGLLAFFGAPQVHEDDPERAALAAGHIHQSVAEYARELDQPLQVRVGINTGRVVMGEMGGEIISEYTAMGQPINLAARLQDAATPGHTLLGETTARLVRHRFEVESVEPLKLKGFDEPMPAFELVGERAKPESARGIIGLYSPLVGREAEWGKLTQLVEGLEAGRGGIVSLIGEPGIGKSRLLQEIKETYADRPLHWAEGRAYSYGGDLSYGVILDLLRELLDLAPDDSPAVLDIKLERTLEPLFGEAMGEVWPFLAVLLGTPVPPQYKTAVHQLDPEALNASVTRAVRRTVEALAQRQPLVISFDDLHWADPSSLDLIESLMISTERAPVLIALLFRAERDKPCWTLKVKTETDYPHRYVELALVPLDETASRALVENLLTVAELPDELRRLILEKSEGNPFFVEELIRELIEAGAVVREGERWRAAKDVAELGVPDTLHEVIQARLDRLPRLERATLQAASVLGRRFAYRVLEAVAPENGSLSYRLLTLQRVDLLRERARLPELEYIFKHAVVQQVTYDTLLDEQRRALHRQAGEAIEQLYGEQIEEQYGLLGYHYLAAGEKKRAFGYLEKAGDRALVVYTNQEAEGHYRAALDLVDSDSGRARLLTEAQNKLGSQPSALEEPSLSLAEAHVSRGEPEDRERARERLREALTIFEQLDVPHYAALVKE